MLSQTLDHPQRPIILEKKEELHKLVKNKFMDIYIGENPIKAFK